jgi:hypothetical protein
LSAERRVDLSVWENNSYLLSDRWEIRGKQFFNRYIGLEGGYLEGTVEVPEPILETTPRSDRFQRLILGLVTRIHENELGKKIEYALRFTDFEQDSSLAGFDYSSRTVSLSADIGF